MKRVKLIIVLSIFYALFMGILWIVIGTQLWGWIPTPKLVAEIFCIGLVGGLLIFSIVVCISSDKSK